jgi:hypothetical protein
VLVVGIAVELLETDFAAMEVGVDAVGREPVEALDGAVQAVCIDSAH